MAIQLGQGGCPSPQWQRRKASPRQCAETRDRAVNPLLQPSRQGQHGYHQPASRGGPEPSQALGTFPVARLARNGLVPLPVSVGPRHLVARRAAHGSLAKPDRWRCRGHDRLSGFGRTGPDGRHRACSSSQGVSKPLDRKQGRGAMEDRVELFTLVLADVCSVRTVKALYLNAARA